MFVKWTQHFGRQNDIRNDLLGRARQEAYWAVLGVLRDRHRAEELAQDALTDTLALRCPGDFRTPRHFLRYVARAARLRSFNEIRYRRRFREFSAGHEIESSVGSPEKSLEHGDVVALLQASIDALVPLARQILRLRFDGRRLLEISRELGMSITTVWRHEGRALRVLRARLAAVDVDVDDCGRELRDQLKLNWEDGAQTER